MLNFIGLRPLKLHHKQQKKVDDFYCFHAIELHATVINVKLNMPYISLILRNCVVMAGQNRINARSHLTFSKH